MLSANTHPSHRVLRNGEHKCPVKPLFESLDECPEQVLTQIEGNVPQWLSGALVRIGPGKFEFGDDKFKHWFDGSGILQKFSLKDGRVTFQSRFLATDVFKTNTAHNRIAVTEFGTAATPDPCSSMFTRLKSWFVNHDMSDNVNVNVIKHGDALLATTDTPIMHAASLTDLHIKEKVNMTEVLSLHTVSSHSHFDRDGSLYILGSSFNKGAKHHIVRVPPSTTGNTDTANLLSKAEIISTIPSRSSLFPSYSHSFGMSENYFIYCETPVTMNLFKLLKATFLKQPANTAFNYNSNSMATFHIVKKSTGEVLPVKFQTKGLFFFHTINCYEDDEHIVMDLCQYSDFEDASLFSQPLEEFRSGKWQIDRPWEKYKQYPTRIVFPLHADGNSHVGTNLVTLKNTQCKAYLNNSCLIDVQPERLLPEGEDGIEMPHINYERCNGRKYRYFYGSGVIVAQHFMNALGKVDVEKKTSKRWIGSVNQYPSEPVFISHPTSQSEDDGVILSTVVDVDPTKQDFLLILDAKKFTEIGRAYVPQDIRIPFTFHGSYHRY